MAILERLSILVMFAGIAMTLAACGGSSRTFMLTAVIVLVVGTSATLAINTRDR